MKRVKWKMGDGKEGGGKEGGREAGSDGGREGTVKEVSNNIMSGEIR